MLLNSQQNPGYKSYLMSHLKTRIKSIGQSSSFHQINNHQLLKKVLEIKCNAFKLQAKDM